MFVCEDCRSNTKWPKTASTSYGRCEMCHKQAACHDIRPHQQQEVFETAVIPDPISEEEQRRIVKALLPSKGSRVYKGRITPEAEFSLVLYGACVALGERCPPHWQINLMCGRTDRIMKEGR